MKRFAGFLFFTLVFSNVFAIKPEDFKKYFRLMPEPQKTELLTGKSFYPVGLKYIFIEGTGERPVTGRYLNRLPLAKSPGKGVLTLKLENGNDLPQSPEGYVLEINGGSIVIRSRGEAGLFYGCQTLSQLFEDSEDQNIPVPACRITDYPGVPYRAVHLDIKYHLDAGHYYYRMIDRLAGIKVNAIIVEFEDKLKYRKAAAAGAANAMSVDEFAALSRYAHERHIEISPLVQGLGHVSFILKHDEYRHLRDNPAIDWVFDPVNPETYELQFSLYDDAIAATPYGKYLHVGGDEVRNYANYELGQKYGKSPLEHQMYWLNKVCKYADEHNRIPIFWDDMLLKYSGLIGTTENTSLPDEQIEKLWKENQHRLDENLSLFPKNCVYMRWAYSNPQVLGNVKAMQWYKSHGLKVMGAPAAQNMSPMMPRENSIFTPIRNFCRIATEISLDGLLCTTWDDSSPHFETFWRGLYYYASQSWNDNLDSPEVSGAIFRHRFWAPELGDEKFDFQDQLERALNFWDVALLDKGRRNHFMMNTEFISLPEKNSPGKWSEKYSEKLRRAKAEIERYKAIKENIRSASILARRNHYCLELLNQINELQVYPSYLLLALNEYDMAREAPEKSRAASDLAHLVDSFHSRRSAYEDTFSETRFLNNPDGYILDQNLDVMLANGTNNSDWMHIHEIKMNERIRQLLSDQK